jgi:hypothetical protein
MKTIRTPWRTILAAALIVAPFFALNAIIADRIEPFYSWLDAVPAIRNSPLLPLGLVALLPVAAFLLLAPASGARRVGVAGAFSAAFLLAAFAALSVGFGEEIMRCDVEQTANCD